MPETRLVDAWRLREMFNDGRYVERAAAGELIVWTQERHPSPPLSFEPYCTLSQTLRYLEKDPETGLASTRLAVAHQYLRPDKTVGASGRPDPKSIFKDDILYVLDPDSAVDLDPATLVKARGPRAKWLASMRIVANLVGRLAGRNRAPGQP